MRVEKQERASVKALVHGRVQAVGFRFFTVKQANNLGLTGYVRNLENGTTVECVAEGERTGLLERKSFSRLAMARFEFDFRSRAPGGGWYF